MEQKGEPGPSHQVLVVYASKYGSTRDIAEYIAQVLRASKIDTDVRPAEEVTRVGPYDAVVLGSGVYFANWLPEAVELLESFQEELATKPLWLFSTGPTEYGGPHELAGDWRYPASLAALVRTTAPLDVALFGGKIESDKLSLEDWLVNPSLRETDNDFRDWKVIETWAKTIAVKLHPGGKRVTQVL